jgi:hypothetical protein
VCIRYRGDVSTEPLPSNDKGIFTELLSSNDRGIQIQTQTDGRDFEPIFLILKKINKSRVMRSHSCLCVVVYPPIAANLIRLVRWGQVP